MNNIEKINGIDHFVRTSYLDELESGNYKIIVTFNKTNSSVDYKLFSDLHLIFTKEFLRWNQVNDVNNSFVKNIIKKEKEKFIAYVGDRLFDGKTYLVKYKGEFPRIPLKGFSVLS